MRPSGECGGVEWAHGLSGGAVRPSDLGGGGCGGGGTKAATRAEKGEQPWPIPFEYDLAQVASWAEEGWGQGAPP